MISATPHADCLAIRPQFLQIAVWGQQLTQPQPGGRAVESLGQNFQDVFKGRNQLLAQFALTCLVRPEMVCRVECRRISEFWRACKLV